jgi:hypothetical protein
MQKSISINVPGGHISGNVVTAVDYAAEMFITIPYDKFACIDLVMVCLSYRRKGMGSLLVLGSMTQASRPGQRLCLQSWCSVMAL